MRAPSGDQAGPARPGAESAVRTRRAPVPSSLIVQMSLRLPSGANAKASDPVGARPPSQRFPAPSVLSGASARRCEAEVSAGAPARPAGVNDGVRPSSSAAAPATCGADADVPLKPLVQLPPFAP